MFLILLAAQLVMRQQMLLQQQLLMAQQQAAVLQAQQVMSKASKAQTGVSASSCELWKALVLSLGVLQQHMDAQRCLRSASCSARYGSRANSGAGTSCASFVWIANSAQLP
jgi:hypothetical protein